jgi:cbb3-type cytochrome oxidase subunit 3
MIGSLTTLFDKDTPDIILNTVRDELLFTVRIDMSLGIYESDKIKKVVYGDLIEHKINSSFMTSEVQSEEGKGKTTIIIAILFSVFAIALLGVLLFVFRKGKRTHNAEVHSIDGPNDTTWRMALDDTGKSWKEKLYTYKTDASTDNNRSSALVMYESKRNKLPDVDGGEFINDDGSVSRIEMINEQQPKKAGLFTRFMHSAPTTSEEEKQVDNAIREYNEEKQHDAVGEQNVNSMTISAMKAELESHNIATDKILEKGDLIDTLLKVRSDSKIDSSSSIAES